MSSNCCFTAAIQPGRHSWRLHLPHEKHRGTHCIDPGGMKGWVNPDRDLNSRPRSHKSDPYWNRTPNPAIPSPTRYDLRYPGMNRDEQGWTGMNRDEQGWTFMWCRMPMTSFLSLNYPYLFSIVQKLKIELSYIGHFGVQTFAQSTKPIAINLNLSDKGSSQRITLK